MSHTAFYEQARFYEIAFGYRDIRDEVSRLMTIYRHLAGRELESFLEFACGPGYHTLEFARRGVRAVGIDLCGRMVELARDRAREQWLSGASFMEADMREFTLPEPVDMTGTFLTSLMYLLTDDDLRMHFRAVADCLAPGGLYLIEANDPRDYRGMKYHGNTWVMSGAGVTVQAAYGIDNPPIDPVSHLFTSVAEYRVKDSSGNLIHTLRDEGRLRALWPEDFARIVSETPGLEIAGIYGDWDEEQPLDESENTWRAVIVVRKTRAVESR